MKNYNVWDKIKFVTDFATEEWIIIKKYKILFIFQRYLVENSPEFWKPFLFNIWNSSIYEYQRNRKRRINKAFIQ